MFEGRVLLEVPEDDAGLFVLRDRLVYVGARDRIVVAAGLRTDLGSVPPLLWWLVRPYGDRATRPYLLHDALCRDPGTSRRDADNLLRRALEDEGVPELRARLVWAAVRIGSRLDGATAAERAEVHRTVPLAALLLWPTPALWACRRLLHRLERRPRPPRE